MHWSNASPVDEEGLWQGFVRFLYTVLHMHHTLYEQQERQCLQHGPGFVFDLILTSSMFVQSWLLRSTPTGTRPAVDRVYG
jgi:hypothetical protein